SSRPFRPAASMTEKARYGLQAGSGARYSMRVEDSLPDLARGTRTSADRLLRAQETCTGASEPGMSRLYEFTSWFVTAVLSRAWTSRPAMKLRPALDSLYSSSGSWKALVSPSNSERWVCMPDPCTPWRGLGMNVA